MASEIVGRQGELAGIESFLDDMASGSRTLVLVGEAGIGKTTLWAAGLDGARRRSYRIFSCRPAEAEVRLGYAALTDLFGTVEDRVLEDLPIGQRRALNAALLRGRRSVAAPDPRAVAVGCLSVLEGIAVEGPVVVAIDDLQWLDQSSANAVSFALRRLSGRVGVLASTRDIDGQTMPNLRPQDPDRLRRIVVGPLSLAALHHLLHDRTGRSFPRPVLVRINNASAGNPFYALEIVRAIGDGATQGAVVFPRSLRELLDARIAGLGPDVREALLAVSALADPRIDVVRRTFDGGDGDEMLERAESQGVVEIERGRVRFTHPFLAHAVYSAASGEQRRAVHRRLSGVVDGMEERARHLALAALGPEPKVLAALDTAAAEALARGAPAAAAELFELAMGLGADGVARQVLAADCHCQAGDPARARMLIENTIPRLQAGPARAGALGLLGMIHCGAYRLSEAATALRQAINEVGDDLELRSELEVDMAFVLINLGKIGESLPYALAAIADAEQGGDPGLLAQALASGVMASFVSGHGLDETALVRALGLEDCDRRTRVHRQPMTIAGLCYLFTGRFDEARTALVTVREGCLERGEEADLPLLMFWMVLLECWRGDPGAAHAIAADMFERAMMLGTPVHHAMSLAAHATVNALTGQAEEARRCAHDSLALFAAENMQSWAMWPLAALCLVDVSMRDYATVAATAGPVAVAALSSMGLAEPAIVPLIPDVAEALIALGRLEEAEALVDQLEERGRSLDRAWALAVGGRGRALLLAARGDVAAAARAIDQALVEHDRVACPLDRARSLLVKGQLHRRAKEKRLARDAISEALGIFEAIGSRHWAARACDELSRVNIRPSAPSELTVTERRIAELAGAGMTNKEIAVAAFVTPKTVEANLARVYRKLGIGSRAQLGSCMALGGPRLPSQATQT